MAERIVVYWRDIPAQVIVRAGRRRASRELGPRFIEAVDRAAMHSRARDTDAYLAAWRRGEPEPCGGDLELEAEAARVALEAIYDDTRLAAIVAAGGFEAG